MALVLKTSDVQASVGSNPTLSVLYIFLITLLISTHFVDIRVENHYNYYNDLFISLNESRGSAKTYRRSNR